MKIQNIKAREILDSKGNPTIEVDLVTKDGLFRSAVPSGSSTGKYEAHELRDGKKRYNGLGVQKAIQNINKILAPKLKGMLVTEQEKIDNLMIKIDGTKNKSKLGANAILGVSLSVCRAGAAAKKMPLWRWISKLSRTKPKMPVSLVLFIEGGLHGGGNLDVQEFMAFPESKSFKERLRMSTEIYYALRDILIEKYDVSATNVGIEGAFTPLIKKTRQGLDLLMEAVKKSGHEGKIKIVLDVAASSFFKKNRYNFEEGAIGRKELLDFYLKLVKDYPIVAIEDPFHEEDWRGFQEITRAIGKKVTIIGDDLLVTNIERMKRAKNLKACNGVIIKLNQIGTVTETIKAIKFAVKNKWQAFIKHRGGETEDSFISDLAVGSGCGWIMAGAPSRGERVAKYNQLLRIEEELK